MATLYENLGGQAALDAVVPALCDKVLTDDRVSSIFKGVGMERQGRMLKAFLTMGFGGPDDYAGKSLRQGHKHLVDQGLNDEHFDAVAGHIKSTVEDLNLPAELVHQVMGAAGSLRDEVLNKPEEAVAPQATDETEEPVAVAEEVTSEMTSDDGAEATPVKTPRARKTSGTGTARRKKAATADTPTEQEVPVTADYSSLRISMWGMFTSSKGSPCSR